MSVCQLTIPGALATVPGMTETTSPYGRSDAILNAAFQAFATYGFRRTSMDDIARGAGMSRSALYLHYRNKEDIFRSLTQRFLEGSVAAVAAVLAEDGRPPDETLAAAFAAKDGSFMEVVLGTAHGSELMDAGTAISCDLVSAGEARIVGLLTHWLERRTLPEGIGSAREIAETIMVALKGLKSSASDIDSYRAGRVRLARLFGRALSG